MDKAKLKRELKEYANGGGVITPKQLASFMGLKKANRRVYRVLNNLEPYEKYSYLIDEVADEYTKLHWREK